MNGGYAVEISQGACKDTSACHQIITIGTNDFKNDLSESVSFYPNPTSGIINIANSTSTQIMSYRLIDITGKVILRKSSLTQSRLSIELPKENGVYFINLELEDGQQINKKVVKL
jgi:hypothetical protein